MTHDFAEAILRLAERVSRLKFSRNDPERFFFERSDVEEALKALAGEIAETADRRDPKRAREAFRPGTIAAGGRLVQASVRRARKVE